MSDIQDYIEYTIKKQESLTEIPPIHVYIYRINSRSVFKAKDGCKLELQTPKTMELLGSTEKLIEKTKNWQKLPSLEEIEPFLVQCNLVDNQCKEKSEML